MMKRLKLGNNGGVVRVGSTMITTVLTSKIHNYYFYKKNLLLLLKLNHSIHSPSLSLSLSLYTKVS